MAKLVGPALSLQASGLLGEILFLPQQSATHAGKRSCEHVPLSGPSANARARFQTAALAWRSLSPAQIATWVAAAGNPTRAHNLFLGNNARLLSLGLPICTEYAPVPDSSFFTEPFYFWDSAATAHLGIEIGVINPDDVYIRALAACSTLRRSTIAAQKYAMVGHGEAYTALVTAYLPFAAPCVHLKLQLISALNGSLLAELRECPKPDWQ